MQIKAPTLSFLRDLAKHNYREWFQAHRTRYEDALANVRAFADDLIERMNRHDRIETPNGKEALYRIYNDQRFHKEKLPYKEHLAGSLVRSKPALRGGYYFQVKPGASFIGCGFWDPGKEDLKRLHTDILYDHPMWESLLNGERLKRMWGGLEGAQLKTAPRGFPKDHPAMGLLRRTQFLFTRRYTDKQVLDAGWAADADRAFQALRPWLDHMSEVLTTDENGNPV